LENIRKQKKKGSLTQHLADDNPKANKRYLILSYVADYERIYHPLPLSFEVVGK
jgi:hypothetical protein